MAGTTGGPGLIVECDECSTRFQLDESRIPARGIRVRCSRCKHAFFLKRPDASQAEALQEVATEAAQAAAVPAPDSTQDLSPQSAIDGDAATTVAVAEENAESGEEDDWEFNHDEESEGSEDDAFAAGDDDGFELDRDSIPLEESDEEASIDLADPDEPVAAVASVEDASPDPEAGFGGVDEMDALSAVGDEPAGDPALSDDARDAVHQLLDSAPQPQAQPDSDLGDPENWDFFSDDAVPDSTAAAQAALPAPALASPSTADVRAEIGDGLDAYVPQTDSSSRTGVWLAAAGRAAGWTLTLGLLLVGGVYGLFPEFQPIGGRTSDLRVGDLRVSGIESVWLDNARSGPILTIAGVLHNPSPTDGKAVDGLSVELLDDQGVPLEVEPGYAGRPLDEDVLRQLPADTLLRVHAGSVADLGEATLQPGESLPFAVLFPVVPAEARRFQVRGAGEERAENPIAENDLAGATEADSATDAGLGASEAQALELAPATED